MLPARPSRRDLATLVAAGALGLTAACSGDDAAPADTPEQAIAKAKETLAGAKFVKISLATKELPAGQNGVAEALGSGEFSATDPKFQGTIQGRVNGVTANLELIGIGDKAWWKLFTPDFTPADLAGVGAPNPSAFFHPETGLPGLLGHATDLKAAAQSREGGDVLTTYTGKLPGSVIKDLLALGDGTGSFDITFGITKDGELRRAVTTGPFFTGSTSTYTLLLTDYGKAVTITAPM